MAGCSCNGAMQAARFDVLLPFAFCVSAATFQGGIRGRNGSTQE